MKGKKTQCQPFNFMWVKMALGTYACSYLQLQMRLVNLQVSKASSSIVHGCRILLPHPQA